MSLLNIIRLLQMSDSTFPVGSFSFSNGLETAAYEGLVCDAKTLEQYVRVISDQGAYSDGVAALLAYRAACKNDFSEVERIDKSLVAFKLNEESRVMLQRMGRKMAELTVEFYPQNDVIEWWWKEIKAGATPGCYPIAEALSFAAEGLSEEALFAAHQYGVINMVLGAALRIVKVSHFETQGIMFRLAEDVSQQYLRARLMSVEDMTAFAPELDIITSLHEKGNMRMFMS